MLLRAGTFTVFAAVKQSLQEETVHFCKSLNNWIKTKKIFRKTACLNFSLFLVQMQELKAHIYLKKIIILVGQRPPNSLFHSSFLQIWDQILHLHLYQLFVLYYKPTLLDIILLPKKFFIRLIYSFMTPSLTLFFLGAFLHTTLTSSSVSCIVCPAMEILLCCRIHTCPPPASDHYCFQYSSPWYSVNQNSPLLDSILTDYSQ